MTAAAPEERPAAEGAVDLGALSAQASTAAALDALDRDLVGLAPVKARLRQIAALLVVDRARSRLGIAARPPSLHMCFTGNPGTGKTTVALRTAEVLHGLGWIRRPQVVSVGRDDLVGQWVGHTAPKTREVLKRAMGGVLFVDEAYSLYRPGNERDYGQEAVEILLQTMEAQRDDLVVILAGYRDRMEEFFACNPGFSSRIGHHLDFPDYAPEELLAIAERMAAGMSYAFSPASLEAMREYIARRRAQPRFANARSIRNALDRARLRHASRLFGRGGGLATREELMTFEPEDVRSSRVFAGEEATP